MSTTYRKIEWQDKDGLQKIADLHMELLHFGPFAKLGKEFVRDICYKVNMKDGLMKVELCEISGEPAGFVAYVNDSLKFHDLSLANNLFTVSLALFRSILRDPSRIVKLFRIARMMASRRSEVPDVACQMGEVVCIAAKPEFLTLKFIRQHKEKISKTLVRHALQDLKEMQVCKARMIVDEDNKAPLFLYHSMGARIEKHQMGGEGKMVAIFELNPPQN
jgi:hypothetical protein